MTFLLRIPPVWWGGEGVHPSLCLFIHLLSAAVCREDAVSPTDCVSSGRNHPQSP